MDVQHLTDLASCMPPFVYITDTVNQRTTANVLDAVLRENALFARVNAVACVTQRVFYDTVLNALAGWTPSWENGCQVWPGDDAQRYNDSIDSFLHGLRRIGGKGKSKADMQDNMVILVERAERLPERLPELIVSLSRLAELSRTKVSVVFLSSVSWEHIRPPLGASPDPYYIDVEPLEKQDVLQKLVSAFRSTNSPHAAYHPALQPLYEQYVDTLYDAVSMYTTNLLELQYIAAARWPGFAKPVLLQYDTLVQQAKQEGSDPPELVPPATEGRLRLIKHFLPSFTAALETLYPRLDNAADWAAKNDYGATDCDEGRSTSSLNLLPRMSKFILVAAFLASTNPAKSDLRMFGRGPEERKKRRRKSGASPKKGGQTVVKASQRLLGPAAFPLDRLLAILGALLEEYDDDVRPHDPGECADIEVGRVHVYAAIGELTMMRTLHRTSGEERMDGHTFKCGIGHDVALMLARELNVPLNEMMWDPA